MYTETVCRPHQGCLLTSTYCTCLLGSTYSWGYIVGVRVGVRVTVGMRVSVFDIMTHLLRSDVCFSRHDKNHDFFYFNENFTTTFLKPWRTFWRPDILFNLTLTSLRYFWCHDMTNLRNVPYQIVLKLWNRTSSYYLIAIFILFGTHPVHIDWFVIAIILYVYCLCCILETRQLGRPRSPANRFRS